MTAPVANNSAMVVFMVTRADKDTLLRLGLDMTEHGGRDALGAVRHGRRIGPRWPRPP